MESDAGSLDLVHLARIDNLITQAQARGLDASDAFYVMADTPEEQATATPDAHHPLFDLSDHDVEIVAQIRDLASQIEHTSSIEELVRKRSEIVQRLQRG